MEQQKVAAAEEKKMDPQEVAAMEKKKKARMFVESYYNDYAVNRRSLMNRYREGSVLILEGHKYEGLQKIGDLISLLPKVVHYISTFDCQLTRPIGAVIVLVYGMIVFPGEIHPAKFSQTFYLMPDKDDFYVLNENFQIIHAIM